VDCKGCIGALVSDIGQRSAGIAYDLESRSNFKLSPESQHALLLRDEQSNIKHLPNEETVSFQLMLNGCDD
jgi:hypothetical protein